VCSIFGTIGKNLNGAKSAFNTLSHRGKDSQSFTKAHNYFFGSHRLAITSFNKEHNQPLIRGDYIAIFNGEIYNYKELIKTHNLNATDEIETILELFLQDKNLHSKLRGMFAISIYNSATNELYLYRDTVGKKPLYYSFKDSTFYFASEIKAITKEFGFNLEKRAIHHYLGYGTTVAPTTLQKNIYKLPPASVLYFNGANIKVETKEALLEQDVTISSKESASKLLGKELKEAVAIRVPKNLKWGVLVSGGLDSSLVAALASKESSEPIDIFSIGYEGYSKYDERIFAKEVAKHLNANFYSYNFTKADFFNTLEEMLELIDEPIGDPAQIPLYFLIKKAKEQGIKVLLSGDGSDELFLGYRTYKEYHMMQSVTQLPYSNWLKNHLRANFSQNKEWEWYKRALKGEVIFRSSAEIYTDRQLNLLLKLQEKDNKNLEPLLPYWQRFNKSNRDIIDWYSYADIKVQLAEFFLSKIDRVSMANGVEVRSPIIDNKIVELAFKIEPTIRFNPQNVKEILKDVALNYLPASIIERKKKGLNYPFLEWILEEDGIELIYKANQKHNFLKVEHLDYLSQKAKNGKFRQHLFPLFILAKFLLK
jgi:asparagine synthase (glutamine-hydrolysing)